MPKRTIETHPLARDPIITRNHTHTSMSGEQIIEGSDTIPDTPVNEQRRPTYRYVLVSPTLGPITIEKLLKHHFDNNAEVRRRFDS